MVVTHECISSGILEPHVRLSPLRPVEINILGVQDLQPKSIPMIKPRNVPNLACKLGELREKTAILATDHTASTGSMRSQIRNCVEIAVPVDCRSP
jgi:hypothetical protein